MIIINRIFRCVASYRTCQYFLANVSGLTCSWKCFECGTSRFANAPPCNKWCNSYDYMGASGTESCGDSAHHQKGIDCTGCPGNLDLLYF